MACPCCRPAPASCSCNAIADNLDLTSIDYSFTSDWTGGGPVSGTLQIAGAATMATSCFVEDTKYTLGGGGFDTSCKNTTYPRKDNSLTLVQVRFSHSCQEGPVLELSGFEYVGASYLGNNDAGCRYCACVRFLDYNGDSFDGRNTGEWPPTATPSPTDAISSFAIPAPSRFYSRFGTWYKSVSSNYDIFRTTDGAAWSSVRYPAKTKTSQTTFSRTFKNWFDNTITATATLNFNPLP
jgi:hypothetical protein